MRGSSRQAQLSRHAGGGGAVSRRPPLGPLSCQPLLSAQHHLLLCPTAEGRAPAGGPSCAAEGSGSRCLREASRAAQVMGVLLWVRPVGDGVPCPVAGTLAPTGHPAGGDLSCV